MNRSILANNDNCFLSILSAQPQEPITFNIWRFIFYIGFYGVHVYVLVTFIKNVIEIFKQHVSFKDTTQPIH